jgi:hypothetical protein
MCDDCKSIADEYVELLVLRSQALANADRRIEDLTRELEAAKREAATWEKLTKMGMPAIVLKWMDERGAQALLDPPKSI